MLLVTLRPNCRTAKAKVKIHESPANNIRKKMAEPSYMKWTRSQTLKQETIKKNVEAILEIIVDCATGTTAKLRLSKAVKCVHVCLGVEE